MSRRRDPVQRRIAGAALVVALGGTLSGTLSGCTGSSEPDAAGEATDAPGTPTPTTSGPTTSTTAGASAGPSTSPTSDPSTTSSPSPEPPEFRASAAMHTVRTLALRFGPREAASPAYRGAAAWVEQRFRTLGYDVRQQRVHVPAGTSWGVDVDAGTTTNVIANPPDHVLTQPHLVVSAHLDTVPQAPGAEDDASGIGVLLELARMATASETRLPVVLVAFGGEEPRGDGDALHHFGSQAMVARMSQAERQAVVGMVSMDRVGVGTVVPVCAAGTAPPVVRRQLLRAGSRVGVPTLSCVNASSDHESFEDAGMASARVGGTSYAAYHSSADLPRVVNPPQLRRVAGLMWEWMRGG